MGNGVVRIFPKRQQDQLPVHKICCALGTDLDAHCGPGDRCCRVGGGGGREEIGKI